MAIELTKEISIGTLLYSYRITSGNRRSMGECGSSRNDRSDQWNRIYDHVCQISGAGIEYVCAVAVYRLPSSHLHM